MRNRLPLQKLRICVFLLFAIVVNLHLSAKELNKPVVIGAGTYTIGTGGSYTSINNAIFGGISGPVILELLSTYAATSETLGVVSGASATNTITIRPVISSTKTYSLTSTSFTFQINGGKYYIIDGRAGGLGTTKGITIENTNAGGAAVSFIGDANNNIITYCILKGASTSVTSGVVVFGNATSTGNDNNTITNCDITSSTTLATNGIYSKGQSATKSNDANTISNCNIYDIFNATQKSVGVLMTTFTSGWTIDGNSFYQMVNRSTSNVWEAIELNNKATGGNGFTISNNFIGGSAASATGSAMDFTFTTLTNSFFSGISIYGFSGAANVVSGNTVKNLSIACDFRNLHYGIYHSDGTVNITGNTIGALTGTGSIVFNSNAVTVSGVSPAFTAICGGGGSTSGSVGGNVNIQNNNVGSITSNATGGAGANEFRGIFYQGSASLAAISIVDISGNTVGGTVANSIYNSGNGATVGIVISSGYSGASHTIKNNTVKNISSSNSAVTALGSLEGITTQGTKNKDAAYIVESNTISNLAANNAFNVYGFKNTASVASQTITKNKIYNLQNSSNLAGANVIGIELSCDFITCSNAPSASASELSKNTITNLEMTATTPPSGSVACGLSVYAGRFNIINNMIAMGYGIGNAAITKSYSIVGIANGIYGTNTAYFNFYYNTVHVGGAGAVSGSPDSKCYSGNNTGTTSLKNNIFYNSRTNAAGTTAHYSFLYTNLGTTTSDYNVLSVVAATGIVAGYFNGSTTTDYATTDALFAAKAIDGNSFSAPVKFVDNATDLRPVPSPDATNFFIANEALPITGFTTDIDGNTRNTFFPDMGCFEFKGTGCWIGQTSSAWDNTTAVAGNWDDGVIPPSTWDVKIFPNVDPAITQPNIISAAGIATVKNLYLRTTTRSTTNKSLVTVNTGTLQIYGDVKFRKNAVYSGAIDATLGTIDMKGSTGIQTLAPRWFVKTEIQTLANSNTTGLTIAAPTVSDTMLISKALNYGAGTTGSTITTNDNLTLLSRATGTANFGEIVSGSSNTIVGNVNIERYLFAQKAWRFLAAPVQAGTSPNIANAWRESKSALSSTGYGAQITGPTGPAVAANGGELDFKTQRGSMKYYNDASNVWVELGNTTTTKVANTQGYMVFVRGDRGAANTTAGAGTATNMRIKGDIRTGDQTFNILAAGVGVTKFQSIGNPYPSEINFASITKTNSYDGFIVWNPIRSGLYGVGGYENYSRVGANYYLNGNTGAGFKIRNTIQSGEAFFVQNTNAPAGTITIKEADKGTGSTLVSRASNADVVIPTINMQLFEKDGTGNYQLMDGATASFDNNYSQAADNNDMVKFTNANDNLFIKSNNKELVVESRPVPTEADSIQLGLTGTRAAAYRLQIDPYVFDNITVAPFLVDKYLQTTTALSTNDATNYDFAITADAASKAADRFVIVFKQGATTHFTTIAAARNTDKTITVNFGTANEKNVTNYTVEQSNDGTNFIALPTTIVPTSNIGGNPTYTKQDATASKAANWYRVKTANSNGSTKYSAIAMVAAVVEVAADATPAINIYPNPVQNGNIQVHFNNQAKGSYSIKVLNQAGQTVGVEQVQIANNRTQKTIQINNLAAGSYQVVITNASGEQTIVPMLAK